MRLLEPRPGGPGVFPLVPVPSCAIKPTMILRRLSAQNAISPYPARSIADLELDEKVYKADFEITNKFQSFSKELVRISLLGLGVYGFLIKLGGELGPQRLIQVTETQKVVALFGAVAFAICAGCALMHGFMSSQCLGHQLVISRYFGRLEGNRWDEHHKELFREEIRRQQAEQKNVLIRGNRLLLLATISLIVGTLLVALCVGLALFVAPPQATTNLPLAPIGTPSH
jgi:hypothetical protein